MSRPNDHSREMGDEELVQMVRRLADGPAFTPGPALASILDDGLETAASPVAGRTTQRSNRMIPRIAAAIAAGMVGMGTLGVAGALPSPVENTLADMASVVGMDVSDDKGDGDDKGGHREGDLVLFSEENDTPNAKPDDKPDKGDKPDNFGDVVHDAKEDGATGQDIADLAHERNAERREERGNPGQGHDKAHHHDGADDADESDESDDDEDESDDDEDDDQSEDDDESGDDERPGRRLGHDK